MKIGFNVKYGRNTITIPTADYTRLSRRPWGANLFNRTVTIYNDIPADDAGVNPRSWQRTVLSNCNIQGGLASKANGTVENIVNAQTVTIRDIDGYLPPVEFYALPVDIRPNYYTMNANDLIVFDEVDDVVTTSREWSNLQSKYRKNSISVETVSVNIYGTGADNISVSNIG